MLQLLLLQLHPPFASWRACESIVHPSPIWYFGCVYLYFHDMRTAAAQLCVFLVRSPLVLSVNKTWFSFMNSKLWSSVVNFALLVCIANSEWWSALWCRRCTIVYSFMYHCTMYIYMGYFVLVFIPFFVHVLCAFRSPSGPRQCSLTNFFPTLVASPTLRHWVSYMYMDRQSRTPCYC